MNKATCRACFSAFALTLCVLGLGLAFLTVECNLQQTVYGQIELPRCFSVEEGIPTLTPIGQTPAAISETGQQGITALLEPGCRLTLSMLRWETEAAARFWTWLCS